MLTISFSDVYVPNSPYQFLKGLFSLHKPIMEQSVEQNWPLVMTFVHVFTKELRKIFSEKSSRKKHVVSFVCEYQEQEVDSQRKCMHRLRIMLRTTQFASPICLLRAQHKAKSGSLAQFRKVISNSSTCELVNTLEFSIQFQHM